MTKRFLPQVITLVGITLITCGQLSAQTEFHEGVEYLLVLPSNVIQEDDSVWNAATYFIEVAVGDDGSLVFPGIPNWKSEGLPTVVETTVFKSKYRKKEDVLVTQFSGRFPGSEYERVLKITVGNASRGYDSALSEIVVAKVPGNDAATQGSLKETLGPLVEEYCRSVFTGPLASVPKEQQWALAFSVQEQAPGARLGHDEFKGGRYFAVDLGPSVSVYNTQQVNQAQRVARSIAERSFGPLKSLSAVADGDLWDGIKVTMLTAFRDFAEEHSKPEFDEIHMFVPLELAGEFAEFEVTDQGMLDGSTIILNGSRARVDLTAQ